MQSSGVPPQLQKKLNLLTYFRKYLPTKEQSFGSTEDAPRAAAAPTVYVKKWLSTPEGYFLRLSNGTLQVLFNDGTGILLTRGGQVVSFASKGRPVKTLWLEQALTGQDAKHIRSRLEYILDRIRKLLRRRNGAVKK